MTETAADHDRPPLPLSRVGWSISAAVFAFGLWGYLSAAGAFGDHASIVAFLASTGAGYLFLAAISGIAQAGAAYGAQAIRRARGFDLDASKVLASIMVAAGATITGWSMHNALERTGMLADGGLAALSWEVALGIPVFEFAVWWVDESLRSKAAALQEAAFQRERAERIAARSPPPADVIGIDPDRIDYGAFPNEALLRVQSIGYAIGKRAADEFRSRRQSRDGNSESTKTISRVAY